MKQVANVRQDGMTSDLIQVDRALESLRDSGFDLSTACGETVDNSIEANASILKIKTFGAKQIDAIAFADNGKGIDPRDLASVLKLGYSTRYNQRQGLGRFGVGMKLAGISQGKRIDIYTKPLGEEAIYHAYIDLTEISNGVQTEIRTEKFSNFPVEYDGLMQDGQKSDSFESGTLVIWSKIDRLVEGGKFGNSNQQRLQELTKFLARAYRKFINQGLKIQMNEKEIDLHDPLFILESKRASELLGENATAEIIQSDSIEIDGQKVIYSVTLLPEEVRRVRGEGGEKGSVKKYSPLYISDNEGKVSILRNGREIYYDTISRFLPARKDQDRFIGVEIDFPATLDEYFQVRNVKRGAVPVDKLRSELRAAIQKPFMAARKKIEETWNKTVREQRKEEESHTPATDAMKRAEETSPRGRGGLNISEKDAEEKLKDLLLDQGIDPDTDKDAADAFKQKVTELPITLSDGSWPGKELFDITHLNGRAIIQLNHRHPFIRGVYDPVKELADSDPELVSAEELLRFARLVEGAMDVLFMAYAKAENMHLTPDDAYADLRSYWGQFSAAYVQELLK
ncbi:ATP-binding protein [Paenibacillus hunanensis]|uniref:ATP-binding protein n=1 Tax=Paenibacillus hunanensis TaxID=539262 RepID=UPI002A6B018A|nr:ATP-binding protein [Paenibacillus hunanensis]WPP41536.1 ATP-binding protein [Paenibacillus hunanensis]